MLNNFRRIELPWFTNALTILHEEVLKNEVLWTVITERQEKVPAQQHTQSIYLLGAVRTSLNQFTDNIHESASTPCVASFPNTMKCIYRFAEEINAKPGRASYVRLMPRSFVYPHIDQGSYYAIHDRYHFVIDSPGGSILSAGDEKVTMHTGELWWFNNKLKHDSYNDSDEWRTHLIFDMQPHETGGRLEQATPLP